jgi:toluene monooxygenase system ferredoxin subunit
MTSLALFTPQPEYHRVCAVDELWEGEMAEFEVGGIPVLLVHTAGGHFRALQASCPHQRVPLVEGELQGHVLSCRAHQWEIDARTGRGINPHHAHVALYPIKVEEGQVFVSVIGVAPTYSSP